MFSHGGSASAELFYFGQRLPCAVLIRSGGGGRSGADEKRAV